MQNAIMEKIDRAHRKPPEAIAELEPGNQIKVHVKIKEGEKERIQIFEGILLGSQQHRHPRDDYGAEGKFRPRRRTDFPAALAGRGKDRGRKAQQGAARQAVLPAQAEGQGRAPEGAVLEVGPGHHRRAPARSGSEQTAAGKIGSRGSQPRSGDPNSHTRVASRMAGALLRMQQGKRLIEHRWQARCVGSDRAVS